MSAVGRYFLDGIDMYTGYGFVVTSGSDGMLQMPSRKLPLSKVWAEQNGTEWDLSQSVKREDRQFRLSGYIVCTSESEFWTKYAALETAFMQTGYRTLTNTELSKSYKVFYTKMTDTKRKTRIKNSTLIGVEIEIELQEVYIPQFAGGYVYYGYSSALPSTQALVLALPNSQDLQLNTLLLQTGLNRIFTVAHPVSRTLSNAFDNTSNEDVTSLYVGTVMTINGESYMRRTMENAFAYSTNHTHNITLT